MARTTYFNQECPTCGRSLQVRVDFLGKEVICKHCHGQFEACDPGSKVYPPSDSGIAILRRAGELLNSSDDGKPRPR